jgi:uncharacterized protein
MHRPAPPFAGPSRHLAGCLIYATTLVAGTSAMDYVLRVTSQTMNHRVVHFEIHTDQPERAIAFYSALFGWRFDKWAGPMPYWLITTGPDSERGINGGLVARRGPRPAEGQPVNAYGCTIAVDDLDALIAKVPGLGGSIALPKMPIPQVGWLAYAKDTEGNVFGMMQNDSGAK